MCEETVKAECGDAGYQTFVIRCGWCNCIIQSETVDIPAATDHDWRVIKVESKCDEPGYVVKICDKCGKIVSEPLAPAHVEEVVAGFPASCTESGLTDSVVCSLCGEVIVAGEEIPALGHSYVETIVEPTCTDAGYTVCECEVCGDSYVKDVTPAAGHSFVNYVSNEDATCITDGTKTAVCEICGATDIIIDEGSALGHDYVAEVVDPTCVDDGATIYTCSRCGDSYTEVIPALGHEFGDVTVVEPTCTEGGYSMKTCAVCNYAEIFDEVPALGHSPAEAVIENEVAPTCVDAGSYESVVYCDVCGAELSRDVVEVPAAGHDFASECIWADDYSSAQFKLSCANCNLAEFVDAEVAVEETEFAFIYTATATFDGVDYVDTAEVAKCTHEFDEGVVTLEPTCVDAGEMTYTCGLCGYSYTEGIPALGHTEEAVPGYEPTCTEPGMTDGVVCSVCGEIIAAQEEIPATGHVPGEAVIENEVAADCENAGSYESVVYCDVCGVELSRDVVEVPALGHAFGEPEVIWADDFASAEFVFSCSECMYSESVEAAVTSERTAADDGTVYTAVAVFMDEEYTATETIMDCIHEFDEGVVTLEPTCVDAGVKTFTCGICGYTYTEEIPALGHVEEAVPGYAATCTEPGLTDGVVCSVCGEIIAAQEEIPALGHVPGEAVIENEVAATCTEPGSYDNVVYCSTCNAEMSRETVEVPALGHTVAEIPAVEPTCTESGYTAGTECTVCGEVIEAPVEIPALGHSWSAWETVVLPSAEGAPGTQTRTCATCNLTESRDIIALAITVSVPETAGVTAGSVQMSSSENAWIVDGDWTVAGTFMSDFNAEIGNGVFAFMKAANLAGEVLAINYYGIAGLDFEDYAINADVVVTVGSDKTPVDATVQIASKECEHEFTDETVEPTCAAAGKTVYTCGKCGYSYEVEIPALPHTEEAVPGVAATCTEAGLTDGAVCSVCGAVIVAQEEIPALGHSPAEAVVENEVPATCTEAGSYDSVVYCAVCGEVVSSETVEVPALGHEPAEAVIENEIEATCVEPGSYESVVYCAVCGEEISRDVVETELADHDYIVEVTDATCTEGGFTSYTCSVCGDYFVDDFTEPLGHTEEAVPGYDATCTEPGMTDGVVCSVCGETIVAGEEIPALGHVFGEPVINWANNREESVFTVTCEVCGEVVEIETQVIVMATMENVTYKAVASFDGVELSELLTEPLCEHTWDDGVVTEPTCLDDGFITYTCTKCGRTNTEAGEPALGHTEEAVPGYDATCTEPGMTDSVKCAVCGEILVAGEEIPALGHVEAEPVIENEVAALCDVAGSYDSVVYCAACGEELSRETVEVPALGHEFGEVTVVEPTCTEGGYSMKTCAVCDYAEIFDEVPALGHAFDEPVLVWAEDREMSVFTVTCPVCGAEEDLETTVTSEIVGEDVTYTATAVFNGETYTETLTEPLCEHQWVEVEAQRPTLQEPGFKAYMVCELCGAEDGKELYYLADAEMGMVHFEIADDYAAATVSAAEGYVLPDGTLTIKYTYDVTVKVGSKERTVAKNATLNADVTSDGFQSEIVVDLDFDGRTVTAVTDASFVGAY